MDSSDYSDASPEVEQCIAQPKKRVKVEVEDNLNLIINAGDGHCIVNCFGVHFDTALDKVLDLLDKEFRENRSKYSDFSEYGEGKILLEAFRYRKGTCLKYCRHVYLCLFKYI